MRIKSVVYAVLLSALVWTGCDEDDNDKNELSDADENFVEDVARGNMTEVEFAELAVERATNQSVIDFAQHMITEHTQAQTELKSASDKFDDVDWPNDMDQTHKQLKEQLSSMSGYKFDSVYMVGQVNDHQMTLQLFNSEISNGKESDILDYANKYKPHISEHLEEAITIRDALLSEGNPNNDGD